MRKRSTTPILRRHDWKQSHFRLTGTQLAMHNSPSLSAPKLDTIDVDKYAVACASAPSGNKLSAAFKTLHIRSGSDGKGKDGAFAFQLVPNRETGFGGTGKTHYFAVGQKDERIDWMRELMLAKAVGRKGEGYEVEVYGGE
jgi:hypothetical protein